MLTELDRILGFKAPPSFDTKKIIELLELQLSVLYNLTHHYVEWHS